MSELSILEIDEVSGGSLFGLFLEIANAVIEFGAGFIDGVNAAQ